MYDQRSRLAALLLKEMFGPLVGRVGADLLGFGTKTFGQITATTGQFHRCCGSVTFWYGSGPSDPYLCLTDPDADPGGPKTCGSGSTTLVADIVADPESSACSTPGSGPGINTPDHNSESLIKIFVLKYFNSLLRLWIGIRYLFDPGSTTLVAYQLILSRADPLRPSRVILFLYKIAKMDILHVKKMEST
jgi:hypothetical protein